VSGYDAEACYDGASALRRAQSAPPDLCFIDLQMPGMDGDELAVLMRRLFPDRRMTLVAVTAMSNEEAVRRTAAAGFDAHLVKPAAPSDLIAIAQKVSACQTPQQHVAD
jgi:CheY-like chemotaxis protein